MKEKNSSKHSKTDWDYLAADSDDGIDFSDIPKLDSNFWKNATLKEPQKKDSVTMRLDHDVLTWFRGMGRGYQTKINTVLRSYMTATKHI
ncbi:MAG: 3-oxoacyl-ACP synthase [Spartobacteria bacterium]|nr:3-oxoacyl-ACP synthase [Spartobacteria bacterium]